MQLERAIPEYYLTYKGDGAGMFQVTMAAWRRARGRGFLARQIALIVAFVVISLCIVLQIGPLLDRLGLGHDPLDQLAASVFALGFCYYLYFSVNMMLIHQSYQRIVQSDAPVTCVADADGFFLRHGASEHRFGWSDVDAVLEMRNGVGVTAGLFGFFIAPGAFRDAAHRAELVAYCREQIAAKSGATELDRTQVSTTTDFDRLTGGG